ncbi:MAG: 4-hydroxy-tetrahydrodipicolinate synthase [Bacteroidetes bacterium]|nr:4-hydroxy-tetrahydrodipicolinate synthase [Bacteroidota bacterium]
MSDLLRKQLTGTGVALVTPFQQDGSIDVASFKKIIHNVINKGCQYLVVLGTTGETPVLSKVEKIQLIQIAYEETKGNIPVVVGIGGNNTAALIEDLQTFPLEGAAAILSASPYYSKPSQEGIFQHYKALASASPKPILLYNVPGRTGRGMTAETILRIAREIPNIIGIKEAGGDMVHCMELLKDKPADFMVLSGDDALAMSQIACGMEGVISVAANAFPQTFSQMIGAALKGDFATAKRLNDVLLPAYELMFCENNPAGIKAFMYEQQQLQNVLRLPLVPLSANYHEAVKKYLKELNK